MIFGERSVVGPEKSFTSTELYQYVEKLLKEATQRDKRYDHTSNYGWLKSRDLYDPSVERLLEDLRPLIDKMTSENSATIAVKLDRLTEDQDFTAVGLLALMKNLLLEQESMSLIEKNINGVKEMKVGKKYNKVHPELVGRQATMPRKRERITEKTSWTVDSYFPYELSHFPK